MNDIYFQFFFFTEGTQVSESFFSFFSTQTNGVWRPSRRCPPSSESSWKWTLPNECFGTSSTKAGSVAGGICFFSLGSISVFLVTFGSLRKDLVVVFLNVFLSVGF